MKRLVLILGLCAAGYLGRRQFKSAAHAQRYITLITLLHIIVSMGASSSVKARQTEARVSSVVMPALGAAAATTSAVSPIVSAGNASFLASISQQPAPFKIGSDSTPNSGTPPVGATGGSASAANGALNTYLSALAANVNSALSYLDTLAGAVNGIYDALQAANIFT